MQIIDKESLDIIRIRDTPLEVTEPVVRIFVLVYPMTSANKGVFCTESAVSSGGISSEDAALAVDAKFSPSLVVVASMLVNAAVSCSCGTLATIYRCIAVLDISTFVIELHPHIL